MTNDVNAALIERDQSHLIHPLHSSPLHSNGRVWARGEGAMLYDANGDAFIDGLAGLWNNTCGNGRRELADAAASQMLELGYASGYAGSSNPKAIELAERLARLAYPNINHFYFTSGGGESTDSNIKMARLLLEAPGQAREVQGHLARTRLSRRHPGRDVRDRHLHLLADVRTARPGLLPHPVALPVPVRGAGGGEPGDRGRQRAGEEDP